jgi:hypothetical protein
MASVQMTICLPLVVFVLMLTVQAGAFFHAEQVAKLAADRAVAVARTEYGTADFGQAQAQHVLQVVGDGSLADPRVSVKRASGEVTVAITAGAPHFVPFWPNTISVSSTGPVEAFNEVQRNG